MYVCIVISGVQVIYNKHATVMILRKPDAYLQLVTLMFTLTDTGPTYLQLVTLTWVTLATLTARTSWHCSVSYCMQDSFSWYLARNLCSCHLSWSIHQPCPNCSWQSFPLAQAQFVAHAITVPQLTDAQPHGVLPHNSHCCQALSSLRLFTSHHSLALFVIPTAIAPRTLS